MIQQEKSNDGNQILFIALPTLIGSAFLYFNDSMVGVVVGLIFLMVGFVYTLSFFTNRSRLTKLRAEFYLSADKTIERLSAGSKLIRYTFSDDFFFYGDDDFEVNVKWELVHSYFLKENYLFVMLENGVSRYFTLGALDIPRSDFDEIVAFVQTKLQPHGLSKVQLKKSTFNEQLIDN